MKNAATEPPPAMALSWTPPAVLVSPRRHHVHLFLSSIFLLLSLFFLYISSSSSTFSIHPRSSSSNAKRSILLPLTDDRRSKLDELSFKLRWVSWIKLEKISRENPHHFYPNTKMQRVRGGSNKIILFTMIDFQEIEHSFRREKKVRMKNRYNDLFHSGPVKKRGRLYSKRE